MASSEAPRQYDFKKAKDEVKSRGLKFVRACLDALGVRWEPSGDHTFVQGWPASGRDSFCVFANGTWKDFNPKGALSIDHGDMVALAAVMRNETTVEALKWVYFQLGWGPDVAAKRLTDAELIARDEAIRKRREEDEARRAAEEDEESESLSKQYLSLPFGMETLVQTYYEYDRGVIFGADGLDHLTRTLRFKAECLFKHPDGTGEYFPAQIAPHFHKGRIVGLHRTYLRLDGKGKAKPGVDAKGKALSVKKNIGRKGIIPLHKGDGNLSVAEAIRRNHKTVTVFSEGIEDAIVAAYYKPEYRAWAYSDKGNLAKAVWPEIASAAIVLLDNDGDTEEEQARASAKVRANFEAQAQGRPLKFFRSQIGNDISDWHKA